MKPIVIKFKFKSGISGIFPVGTDHTLRIEVQDNKALYKFEKAEYTKLFTKRQIQDGVSSKYIERVQGCLSQYPNMKQQDIVKHIKERLMHLSNTSKEVKDE